MSKIYLWKLGNLEHRIYPAQATVDMFADMLRSYQPGEDLNIVWGPDISVEVFDLGDFGGVGSCSHIVLPMKKGAVVSDESKPAV